MSTVYRTTIVWRLLFLVPSGILISLFALLPSLGPIAGSPTDFYLTALVLAVMLGIISYGFISSRLIVSDEAMEMISFGLHYKIPWENFLAIATDILGYNLVLVEPVNKIAFLAKVFSPFGRVIQLSPYLDDNNAIAFFREIQLHAPECKITAKCFVEKPRVKAYQRISTLVMYFLVCSLLMVIFVSILGKSIRSVDNSDIGVYSSTILHYASYSFLASVVFGGIAGLWSLSLIDASGNPRKRDRQIIFLYLLPFASFAAGIIYGIAVIVISKLLLDHHGDSAVVLRWLPILAGLCTLIIIGYMKTFLDKRERRSRTATKKHEERKAHTLGGCRKKNAE